MIAGFTIVFLSFVLLLITSLRSEKSRASVRSRSLTIWIVDLAGLIVQGLAVPLVQMFALAPVWERSLPNLKGALAFPWWGSFLLSFVVIDYVYYWNHRLLHLPLFWRWHRLHHSASDVDIFATARNSLLTPLLIVYLWINSVFVFALHDPAPFLVASSVGAALDLWRHSGFFLNERGFAFRFLNSFLILPQHHARHHAPTLVGSFSAANFGANLKWWDQIHGTFDGLQSSNSTLPSNETENSLRELVWPSTERSF